VTRILSVVQRYGPDVPGGAEALSRSLAERLVARGHDVSVLTSCAVDYSTWADEYPAGTSVERGVRVRRLSVPRPRDPHRFGRLSERVIDRGVAALVQRSWLVEEGPTLPSLHRALLDEASDHDVVAFFTYLYPPTVTGVPDVAHLRPTIVHPTAHDEAPIRIPILRQIFDRADGLAFSTPEERELVHRRFRPTGVDAVIGIGFDDPEPPPDGASFRQTFDLGDRPFLLYLGRVDPNKAADEAIEYFHRYKTAHPGDLALVMVGAPVMEVTASDDVILTGFVSEELRAGAIAACLALVQPSYQESFSMALAEAWLAERPALVQGHCDVLAGLASRAGGAIPYKGPDEFAAGLDVLVERPALRDQLGESGRRHVLDEFGWEAVLDRYELLLDRARARWARRRDGAQLRRATTA
jgi:glycosyltransferase involved in cell wall biosynthesis